MIFEEAMELLARLKAPTSHPKIHDLTELPMETPGNQAIKRAIDHGILHLAGWIILLNFRQQRPVTRKGLEMPFAGCPSIILTDTAFYGKDCKEAYCHVSRPSCLLYEGKHTYSSFSGMTKEKEGWLSIYSGKVGRLEERNSGTEFTIIYSTRAAWRWDADGSSVFL